MNNFKNKIQKFMIGRNGIDDIYYLNFWLYVFLIIIDVFVDDIFLTIFEVIVSFILLYRFFSKNLYVRNRENQKLVNFKKNVKRKWKDRNKYVYKKCPNCHLILKLPLPKKRGVNHVLCPDCKIRITMFNLRKKKGK